VNEHTCKAEIASFAAHGQRVPVLGRRLHGDSQYEIELAYGARRLFAARHLKIPLLVELRPFSDREGLVAMDIENRQRQDVSPYERGLSYRRWLQRGHFETQEEIARTLGISPAQVSRLLQLARLPAVVVDAFRAPTDIRENWGLQLVDALDDPQRRPAMIRSARSLGRRTRRLPASDTMHALLSRAAPTRIPKKAPHDRVVCSPNGAALFRIRYLNKSIALIFAAATTSARDLGRIEGALATLLKSARGVRDGGS
jgi:ParB family chromosome partitioning protein